MNAPRGERHCCDAATSPETQADATVAAVLMKNRGMTADEAVAEVLRLKPAAATSTRRAWQEGDWIDCPRCERQTHDVGSCNLCGNLGILDANGERFHCDCRADDWVEGDNGAIRCERCGGYAGEPGTSIALRAVS